MQYNPGWATKQVYYFRKAMQYGDGYVMQMLKC